MRITIIAVGSRGDAQPYVALGIGLERAGHHVTIATHETFRSFVTGRGLAFAHLSGDPRDVLLDPASERWLALGRRRDLLTAGRTFLRSLPSVLDTMLADYGRVAAGSDLLIYSAVAAPAASAAEQLGIPAVAALLQPLHPTRAFPTIALPHAPRLGGRFNLATHHVASWLAARPTRHAIDAWRQGPLGLPPLAGHQPSWWSGPDGTTTIYGYAHVVPRPRDWGEGVHVTGYWVLEPDRSWRPDAALEAFLAAGPPPIYIGFGSMTPHHAERLTTIVLGALRRAGQRGVLVRGWGGLGDGGEHAIPLPETAFAIDDVPHEWLFPRMAAVVHHGGSGTTGAALRAGVPSIVAIPLGFDQPYWAARVAELGVGPRGVHRRNVTAEWLGDAIGRAIGDRAMRERAAALGARLRAERGVDAAVELVTRAGPVPAKGGRAARP